VQAKVGEDGPRRSSEGNDLMAQLNLPTRQGYDRWAEVYDTDGNPLVALEEPVVRRLLGPVRGRAVVDVGCGTGRHAVRLARAGARVTAVDFSEGMIARARAKPGADRVRFLRRAIDRRLPFADESFDRVLCCLVLEHIRRLGPFFAELARVCRRDGRVVVSAMHPSMWLKGDSARFYDPVTGDQIRPRSYRQSTSDYVMAAARAGLRLDHMSELAPDARFARRFPRALKHVGWPMLLAMRFTMPGPARRRRPS
jgi:malonyl-CoA O-methyltransferase